MCNPAALKADEEQHARSKGYSTSVRARERSAGERGGQGGAVCVGGEGEGAAGSNELV